MEANGWYQLAGYYGGAGETYHMGNTDRRPTPDECLTQFAEHVRIPVDDARVLAEGWRCEDDWRSTRRWFAQWLTTQTARYQREADAAIELLDTLIIQR